MQQNLGLTRAGAMIAQLQRILWLAVRAAGGTVQFREGEIDPLWILDKDRMQDGTLILKANITEPPAEEQMTALATKLRGTKLLLTEVAKEMNLDRYPVPYLLTKLAPQLLWDVDHWEEAALVKGAEKPTGQN